MPYLVKTLLIILLTISKVSYSKDKSIEILENMSMDEKIGQMLLVYYTDTNFVKKHHIGNILIMQNMITPKKKIRDEIKHLNQNNLYNLPVLSCIDQEGGLINRLQNINDFKTSTSAAQLSKMKDPDIISYSKKITFFLNSLNINTNLAPCLDPSLNHDNKPTFMLIKERSFGSSPKKITQKAKAFIKGIKKANGLTIIKHFPGYDVENNSDEHLSISHADTQNIKKYMIPFKKLCKYADGVMMNNIIYRKFDSIPAVLSHRMVKKARVICKEKIIMTDDLWAISLRSFANPGQKIHKTIYPDKNFKKIIKMAVYAGNDILMITYPQKISLIIQTIKDLCKKDPELINSINSSVKRIIDLKLK